MICPYICNIVQANQNTYQYDDDGNNTFTKHILAETKTPMECQKENCAAWEHNHCRFNANQTT